MNTQVLADTIVLASLYAILGTGFVVVYRSSRVLNLAQGELMMLGGYLFFTLVASLGQGLVVSAIVAVLATGVVGALLYLVAIRPLAGQPVFTVVLLTVALAIVIRALSQLLWGTQTRNPLVHLEIENPAVRILDSSVSVFSVAQVLAAAGLLVAVWAMMRYTRWGMQMRAMAESVLLASQRGVNVNVMLSLSWALAAALGGVAGVIYSANVQLAPNIADIGLRALAVPLMGGLSSLGGIIPAALIVGGLEALVAQYMDPLLARTVPFAVILAVIVVRPWGLFGTEEELERV